MQDELEKTVTYLRNCLDILKDIWGHQFKEETLRAFVFSLYLLQICKASIRNSTVKSEPSAAQDPDDLTLFHELQKHGDFFHCKLLYSASIAKEIGESEMVQSIISRLERDHLPTDLTTVCYVYETFNNLNSSNKEGQFYTPQSVVNFIVKDLATPLVQRNASDDNYWPSVLDPSCGSGAFLLSAFDFAIQTAKDKGFDSWQWRCDFLSRCCFGVDKDEQAVEICRILLLLSALKESSHCQIVLKQLPNLSKNLICGNSLFDSDDFDLTRQQDRDFMASKAVFSWKASFPTVMAAEGFDRIIGNPPYGISRNQQIEADENQRLKQIFADYCRGKVNKYLAFMAKGYQLLKPTGVMSFIIPNAWLGIKDGAAIRELLLQHKCLSKLIISPPSIFKELGVETVIFQIKKGATLNQLKIIRPPENNLFDHSNTATLSTDIWNDLPDKMIPTFWSQDLSILYHTIKKNSVALNASRRFLPRIALQAYSVNKGTPPQTAQQVKQHVFHTTNSGHKNALRYLKGQDIKRYSISWSGEYLIYGPWLAEPQKLEWFSGPRIILREVLDRPPYLLRAAYTEETFLYNKSALHILPINGTSRDELLALLAILNSKFASFILCLQGRKAQRSLFPKIVRDDLGDFPLPIRFADICATLARKVESFLNEPKKAPPSQLQLDFGKDFAFTENHDFQGRIDEIVFDSYKFNKKDRKAIDDFLDYFAKSVFSS